MHGTILALLQVVTS